MKTKEYLIKNFIPIAKEEAEGLTDVIECLESIEHYLSIPIEPPVKPAKAIEWKETRWTTDGYVNNIKLFSIAYEGIIKRDKNPYNLTSRLPQLKAVEVESIDEGKNKAQELLNKYIKLLSV